MNKLLNAYRNELDLPFMESGTPLDLDTAATAMPCEAYKAASIQL
jgi:hypothetical protein